MRCQRSGLTIVDWCVIIVCLLILLGLLLPAVNTGHGISRNQCSTNLKNLALAAVQYENTHGSMPGYVMDYGMWTAGETPLDPTDPSADTTTMVAHRKIGTWAVALLPWLDGQPTYEHWTHDRYSIVFGGSAEMPLTTGDAGEGFADLAAPNLAILQCPQHSSNTALHGRNSYICNAGMSHIGPSGESNWIADRADEKIPINFRRSMSIANGVFNNKLTAIDRDGGPVAIGPDVTLDDLTDGAGFTMLFSENLQAMPWHRAGLIDAKDLVVTDAADEIIFDETSQYSQGMVWHYEQDDGDIARSVNPLHRINGTQKGDDLFELRMTRANAADLARPSSAHFQGVNAGFADGATRFISDTIDYRVYQALLTPNGSMSDVPDPSFVISDELSDH